MKGRDAFFSVCISKCSGLPLKLAYAKLNLLHGADKSNLNFEKDLRNLSRFFVVNNLKGERKLIEIFAHRICFCSIAI